MGTQPQFIEINSRRLFCLRCSSEQVPPRYRVLVAPPFGEELNRARQLLTATARRLAASSCDVLIPDLYGTGDSAGEFADACWADWCDDWCELDRWFAANSSAPRPGYLAVRSGALLLAESARRALTDYMTARVVLWQPVLNGAQFLRSVLRARVMSQRLAGREASVDAMMRQLQEEGAIEVVGYRFTTALSDGLAAASVTFDDLMSAEEVRMLEFTSSPDARAVTSLAKMAERMQASGHDTTYTLVQDEQFWNSRDVAAPDGIILATLSAFT